MCRLLAWSGAARYLDELLLNQTHSLVDQSRNALIGKTAVNADGFGVAWYTDRLDPCFYKGVNPAWSDANLKQIAHHTKSTLFFGHVRASTGAAVSRENCHPFGVGRWCFMHNGQAGGLPRFRQKLDGMIAPELYSDRLGATESEAIFLIALSEGLARDPIGAMARAVARVERLAQELGARPYMRFSACWTDGRALFAARYASDRYAPSLFLQQTPEGCIVSSEPLDEKNGGWVEIEVGSAISVYNSGVCVQDFPVKLA